MSHAVPKTCFVVMPFGRKPLRDGSGRHYDFDKVYRVIMQRAIRQAGLEPIRADERKGSAIIHTDMFKDLRDHEVVLADLSLENPNVFYELGIRHVMASRGTVLMCHSETILPFDIHLSRVIFYRYDGQNLDWEEGERVVEQLRLALEEAKRGTPDSPVHALLETVLRQHGPPQHAMESHGERMDTESSLAPYQKLVAEHWHKQGTSLAELRQEHSSSVFGTRALGYLCLFAPEMPPEAPEIASSLQGCEQYDLVIQIYKKLETSRELDWQELLTYGSAISEKRLGLGGAKEGNKRLEEALAKASALPNALLAVARCRATLAGMAEWIWQLSQKDEDLDTALVKLEEARQSWEQLEGTGNYSVGRVALVHLKSLLLLRARDKNRERPDTEHHREAILKLTPQRASDPVGTSYLHWYKALALADSGDGVGTRRLSFTAFTEDAQLRGRPDCSDIGRRQYTHLRRFIEHHSSWLCHPELVGQISQMLQFGRDQAT